MNRKHWEPSEQLVMMRDRGSKVLGDVWFAWYWCACILQKSPPSLRAKGTDWGCVLDLLRTLWPTWQAFKWFSCLVYNAGKKHRTGNHVGDSLPGLGGNRPSAEGQVCPGRAESPPAGMPVLGQMMLFQYTFCGHKFGGNYSSKGPWP